MRDFFYHTASLAAASAAFIGGVVLMEAVFRTRLIALPSELFGIACGAGFFCFTLAAFSLFKR